MRVLMLSDYETQGGAAVAASRLAEGLAVRHDVLRWVLHPDGGEHPWRTQAQGEPGYWTRQVLRLVRRLFSDIGFEKARKRWIASRLRKVIRHFRPDVINVHNLHGGTDQGWGPELVDLCAAHAPTVWALHDMWSFTGRCAYANDCRGFENGCDAACPTPEEYPALKPNAIAPAWQLRGAILKRRKDLIAVAPSRWLATEARRGLWKGSRVEVIPYGLPLDAYRPLCRAESRRRLGLPETAFIALLVAQSLIERRKGAHLLPQVWPAVKSRPLLVVSMGEGPVTIAEEGITLRQLGWVNDPQRQALIYSAADVLLHAAPVDNLPNVVLEALACGTPAIAFPIGGLPDLVRPGISGWLAADVRPHSLAETLDHALREIRGGRDLRGSCRQRAKEDYSLHLQAARYETLFEDLRTHESDRAGKARFSTTAHT